MAGRQTSVFLGRAVERHALDQLLKVVRGGESAVLVIRGEAGVGKTAIMHHCARQASGFRVTQLAGVEAERELPFAALHQLCAPMLARLDTLPEPQRDALGVALGVASGDAPARLLVGLGVLGLLSAVAEERPLLCLVDDAQWLDDASAQVLGFAGRRLPAAPVGLVFAVREPRTGHQLDGLPDLPLGGLPDVDARALLARAVAGPLDDRIRDRLIAETQGNPRALLELPREISAAELAGGFELSSAADLSGQDHYLRRVEALPEPTRELILLAAADPAGEATLVWRAADKLGIATSALAPAVDADVLELGDEVRFRHPLVRSAVYRAASASDRQRVHAALAEVSDPTLDADRRAWHRALAAPGPDEELAVELERSADRAQLRGGIAASGAFLERATELTADPGRRARRALAAAEVRQLSGSVVRTLRLISQADAGSLPDLERARVHLVRGRAAFGSGHGRDAPSLLLAAAHELEPLDPVAARDAYMAALTAALFVGRLGGAAGIADVAQAARAARSQDVLVEGLAIVITEGYATGAPQLKQAVRAARGADASAPEEIRRLWLAAHAAHDLWDDESWEVLCERQVVLARHAGALGALPHALNARIGLHLFAGELAAAAALVEEATAVSGATGVGLPPYGELALAAFRGREAEAARLIDAVRAEAGPRGDGMILTLVDHAEAILYTGLGQYREAFAAAQRGAAHPAELGTSNASLPLLIEAAVRLGERTVAEEALRQLTVSTSAGATDWALGTEARCRALLSEPGAAEPLYREATERLGRTRVRGEHARAHLLFGEWLRRERRQKDAREHLRTAHRLFGEMGMEAFADRARRELAATGETPRKRRAETRDELTPQEWQIARLARDGLSNPEIGARLYLSPRTVEWHLRKVFAKLEITSRGRLHDALPGSDREPARV